MQTVIQLENIIKEYGKAPYISRVLHGIDLAFERGTFNSIIGQSGSGKSTLLNIMGTLDTPTSGKIFLKGTNTTDMKKKELAQLRNQQIGFIFQFHYLLPEFTALENVLMPVRISGKKITPEIKSRAEELMDLVGLSKVVDNKANAMSGGQQQRTAIARALMNNPSIILADEPTGNLDSASTETVYKLLRDLNDRYNTTFIVITHDKHVAERTDRIVEIKDGRVVQDFLT